MNTNCPVMKELTRYPLLHQVNDFQETLRANALKYVYSSSPQILDGVYLYLDGNPVSVQLCSPECSKLLTDDIQFAAKQIVRINSAISGQVRLNKTGLCEEPGLLPVTASCCC